MIIKDIIERGLKEGMRRFNKMLKGTEHICPKDNMLIRAQLEAIQSELIKAKEKEDE